MDWLKNCSQIHVLLNLREINTFGRDGALIKESDGYLCDLYSSQKANISVLAVQLILKNLVLVLNGIRLVEKVHDNCVWWLERLLTLV